MLYHRNDQEEHENEPKSTLQMRGGRELNTVL